MIEPIRNTQDGWPGETLTAKDYLDSIELSAADARMVYGPEPSQWVDVYLPKRGAGPFSVVILVHGGAWSTVASAQALGPNAAELAAAGVAVWNVEYRRAGEPGGGHPGMYLDLGAAADRLKSEASTLGLDLNRVAVVGHSAGAHLALWLGSRRKLGLKSPFHVADALPVRTVVAIAGPGDLRRDIGLMTMNSAGLSTVSDVIGRDMDAGRDRFADISPRELLPTGVRTVSITGTHDDNWPPYVAAHWFRAARSLGDDAEEVLLPNVGHFEVVDVRFDAWRAVRDIILAEVGRLS